MCYYLTQNSILCVWVDNAVFYQDCSMMCKKDPTVNMWFALFNSLIKERRKSATVLSNKILLMLWVNYNLFRVKSKLFNTMKSHYRKSFQLTKTSVWWKSHNIATKYKAWLSFKITMLQICCPMGWFNSSTLAQFRNQLASKFSDMCRLPLHNHAQVKWSRLIIL